MLAVPLRWEQEIIGALIVRRQGHRRASRADRRPARDAREPVRGGDPQRPRRSGSSSRAAAELEVASRHKSEFLASMSHELRTPLNAVIGFSDVLLERMFGELNERQDEYVRDIRDSGRHLLELINEILDLSKVEAGRMELDLARRLAVARCSSTGSRWCASAPGATASRSTLEVDAELGIGLGRRAQAQAGRPQPAHNAVKFTAHGGSVTSPRGASRRRARDRGPRHRHRDRRGRAGARSSRRSSAAAAACATSTEGTGLGLTLSKRIVELHGGRMWMESELGAGSTIRLRDPASRPPRANAAAARRRRSPTAARGTVTRDGGRDRRRSARPRPRGGGARPRGLHGRPGRRAARRACELVRAAATRASSCSTC